MKPLDHAEPGGSDAQPATGRVVGSVAELWRYPVKSMRGGTVSQPLITDRGSVGDRAWALRDPTSGRIASAKRFPRLLEFRATYEVEPTMTTPGRVRIEAPDGQTVYADEPGASEFVSSLLGRRLRLENQVSAINTKASPELATVARDWLVWRAS
jgi:MOSC domain-containing protein